MKKEELIVVMNPGHGKLTPGKCSPDKSYYEYEGNRIQAATFLEKALDEVGIKHKRTVNDDEDVGLSKRSRIANGIIGINKGCLISLHSTLQEMAIEVMQEDEKYELQKDQQIQINL